MACTPALPETVGRFPPQHVTMGKGIPFDLNPTFEIEIDAAPIARALGLDDGRFRQLLEQRKITQLCERGTGEDAGLYRASFYFEQTRARVVVNREGQLVGDVERDVR